MVQDMSYLESFRLANDKEFAGRVSACVCEQAKVFVNDTRPEFYALALFALDHNDAVTKDLAIMVATQPAMSESSTDQDILSAVQYVWPIAGRKYVESEG